MRTRYIFFSILTTALLAACSSDELDIVNGGQPAEGEAIESFKSVMTGDYVQLGEENLDDNTTRANVNTESSSANFMKALWTESDEVSLSDGTNMYSYNVSETANEGTECVFKVLDGRRAYDDAPHLYGIYPRRAVTEAKGGGWYGSTVKGQVFAQQSYTENTVGSENSYFGGYYVTSKAAQKVDGNFQFSFIPMASIIDIDVKTVAGELPAGEQISAVYVKSNDGVALAGHFTYNFENNTLNTFTAGSNPYADDSRSDVVEVNFFKDEDDGKVSYTEVGADGIVRFYVLPANMKNGVTITVRTNMGNFYSKSSRNEVGKNSGQITTTDEYLGTLAKPYYKKYNFNSITSANKGAWMACIPSNLYCTMLSVPGAHNATATTGGSKRECQKTGQTLTELLEAGIRVIDLHMSDDLKLRYYDTESGKTLSQAITEMQTYLNNNPTESIITLLRLEPTTYGTDFTAAQQLSWSNNVEPIVSGLVSSNKAVASFTKNTKLGDCRGKLVFIYLTELTGSNVVYNGCRVDISGNYARTNKVFGTSGAMIDDFLCHYQNIYSDQTGYDGYEDANGYWNQQGQVTVAVTHKKPLVLRYIQFANDSYLTDRNLVLNFANYSGNGNFTLTTTSDASRPQGTELIQQLHERVGYIIADYVTVFTANKLSFPLVTLSNNFKHVFMERSRVDMMKKYMNYEKPNTGAFVSDEEYADDSPLLVRKK